MVRILATRALANLNVDDARREAIAQELQSQLTRDSDRGVRLEAVKALGVVAGPANAEALYLAMDPARETDRDVRQEAWRSLSGLFDKFTDVNALFFWEATRFQGDPPKQLLVNLAIERILRRGVQDAGAVGELNTRRSRIGALYLDPAIARPDQAIPYLTESLQYFDAQPNAIVTVNAIQKNLINAYLWSRKYKEAIQFAEGRINRNRENTTDMAQAIQEEVKRLEDAKQYENQLALLNETENLSIQGIYRDKFNEKRKEARERKPSLLDFFREYYAGQRYTPLYT
jgi:hypothetical protein